ncbi:MAG: type II secretion system protein [Candidatus Melainabacteria bacterium]|nr:type II secretion system protein [Candidatus Melainabacteria bacterium]
MMGYQRTGSGFSLVEVLIAVGLLGLIAAFTIPKLLDGGTKNTQYRKVVQAASVILTSAYAQYKLDNTVSASTSSIDLVPYMDNVEVIDNASLTVDDTQGQPSVSCDTEWGDDILCIRMKNGGVIHFIKNHSFAGTGSLNALFFHVDPDGKYSGSNNGPGKSMSLFLYYDGRMKSFGEITPGTINSVTTFNPTPSEIPSWFSWN